MTATLNHMPIPMLHRFEIRPRGTEYWKRDEPRIHLNTTPDSDGEEILVSYAAFDGGGDGGGGVWWWWWCGRAGGG